MWADFEPTFSQTGFFNICHLLYFKFLIYISINLLNINIFTLEKKK